MEPVSNPRHGSNRHRESMTERSTDKFLSSDRHKVVYVPAEIENCLFFQNWQCSYSDLYFLWEKGKSVQTTHKTHMRNCRKGDTRGQRRPCFLSPAKPVVE